MAWIQEHDPASGEALVRLVEGLRPFVQAAGMDLEGTPRTIARVFGDGHVHVEVEDVESGKVRTFRSMGIGDVAATLSRASTAVVVDGLNRLPADARERVAGLLEAGGCQLRLDVDAGFGMVAGVLTTQVGDDVQLFSLAVDVH